jgi:hypothetical protein
MSASYRSDEVLELSAVDRSAHEKAPESVLRGHFNGRTSLSPAGGLSDSTPYPRETIVPSPRKLLAEVVIADLAEFSKVTPLPFAQTAELTGSIERPRPMPFSRPGKRESPRRGDARRGQRGTTP